MMVRETMRTMEHRSMKMDCTMNIQITTFVSEQQLAREKEREYNKTDLIFISSSCDLSYCCTFTQLRTFHVGAFYLQSETKYTNVIADLAYVLFSAHSSTPADRLTRDRIGVHKCDRHAYLCTTFYHYFHVQQHTIKF